MKCHVRLNTETTVTVDLLALATVGDLKGLISDTVDTLPPQFKLIHNGKKLDDDDAVPHDEEGEVTLILMGEEEKKRKKKGKCHYGTCLLAALRMIGDCLHCHGKFCAKHRLLEDHLCVGLQHCKQLAHEQNAMKLHRELTMAAPRV